MNDGRQLVGNRHRETIEMVERTDGRFIGIIVTEMIASTLAHVREQGHELDWRTAKIEMSYHEHDGRHEHGGQLLETWEIRLEAMTK